jgi:protein-disulfide isomerase
MRALLITITFLLPACGAPPGRTTQSANDPAVSSPARVSVEGDAPPPPPAAEPEEELDDVTPWPTDGGLPGADEERVRVGIGGRPARGASEPLVTVVVFSDFQCPFCSRVNPTLERLLNQYSDDLQIVFRNQPLPFHQDARPAAIAALEAYAQAGDDGFWRMHDLLFANQQQLDRSSLESYAAQIGLDRASFSSALSREAHTAIIDEDQEVAQRVGARGTPTFFINGRKLVGAQPFTAFEDIVDEEIAIAREAMNRGVPRDQLYASVLAVALAEPSGAAARPRRTRNPAPSRRPDPDAVHFVPVGRSPSRGPDDALVTIVEVSDFECPFCSRVQPTLTELERRYGRDLRIVFKNSPLAFHRHAEDAARAALEARAQRGDQGFWEMHDLLFANQQNLGRRDLERYARRAGLSLRRFKRAMGRDAHQATIDADLAFARSLGVRGTPAFFINGRFLSGAQPVHAFVTVIEEELAKARSRVSSGTARDQVYDATIAGGARSLVYAGGGPGPSPSLGPSPSPPPNQVFSIPLPANAPSRGPANAPVTLQVFSDFQCPFCSRLVPTLEALERAYGQRIRIVWRNHPLPFHQDARQAHRAAMEIFRQGGDRRFWQYHDLLFANQRALSRADLLRYARRIPGIDVDELEAALDQNRHDDVIEADMDAVRDAGARIGTPSVFVNGRLVRGARPVEDFRRAIDSALQGAP